MQSSQQVPPQQTYLPAMVPIVGTLEHSLRKVALARLEAPNQVCGVVQRVGYNGLWRRIWRSTVSGKGRALIVKRLSCQVSLCLRKVSFARTRTRQRTISTSGEINSGSAG